jgi:hypothetical protein
MEGMLVDDFKISQNNKRYLLFSSLKVDEHP